MHDLIVASYVLFWDFKKVIEEELSYSSMLLYIILHVKLHSYMCNNNRFCYELFQALSPMN